MDIIKNTRFSFFFVLSSLFFTSYQAQAGEIALSFDDAPTADSALMTGSERTHKIISALKSREISDVLMFVTTGNIRAEDKIRLNQYTAAGFHLGNHSHLHQSANKLSLKEFSKDLQQAKALLAGYDNTLALYRFPYLHYGEHHEAITARQKVLEQTGYANGYVTVDTFDWYISAALNAAKEKDLQINFARAQEIYVEEIWNAIVFYDKIAQKVLGRSPKHILLLHENDSSAMFLSALIDRIRQEGWKIIPPQEAYQDPIANAFPETDFHKQGRVAAIAHAKGLKSNELRHVSESTEYIDKRFKEEGVIKQKEQEKQ